MRYELRIWWSLWLNDFSSPRRYVEALAHLVAYDHLEYLEGGELRPKTGSEQQFRIVALHQQEVAEPDLSTGPEVVMEIGEDRGRWEAGERQGRSRRRIRSSSHFKKSTFKKTRLVFQNTKCLTLAWPARPGSIDLDWSAGRR